MLHLMKLFGIRSDSYYSKGALDFFDSYYKELTARDRALNEENLRRFTPENIGGFVSEFKGKPFRFNNKQREAMAWMEAMNIRE